MYDEQEDLGDFGADALDNDQVPMPFGDENAQFRYYAMISQTDFMAYMAQRIDRTPFTRAAKRSLTDFLAAFFNQSVILSHSRSIREATLRFDLAAFMMKPAFSPSDVRLRELSGILGSMRSQYEFLVSRTIGGAQTRERVLQHGVVQKITHEMKQSGGKEKSAGVFGI